MTSVNKKKKCHRTLYDRGGEKGHLFRAKRYAMYHKKDRQANKKACLEEYQFIKGELIIVVAEQVDAYHSKMLIEKKTRVR